MKTREPELFEERIGRLWVTPNRNSIGLLALLGAMAYAGASQTNAAAYMLGFTLASLAAVSVAHTWANLRGVQLFAGPVRPVFAGESLAIRVGVTIDSPRPRFGLQIRPAAGGRGALLERIAGGERSVLEIEMPAVQRGRFRSVTLELRSSYPLGFCTAFRRVELRAPHLVYPRPAGQAPLPRAEASAFDAGPGPRIEGEDFAGLRAYQRGESQRHIDWKAVARGQPLLTKQWAGEVAELLVFDFQMTPGSDLETRLSQLARWVVEAERQSVSYGLRLGNADIRPDSGEAHLHACLRALALFEAGEEQT